MMLPDQCIAAPVIARPLKGARKPRTTVSTSGSSGIGELYEMPSTSQGNGSHGSSPRGNQRQPHSSRAIGAQKPILVMPVRAVDGMLVGADDVSGEKRGHWRWVETVNPYPVALLQPTGALIMISLGRHGSPARPRANAS